MSDCGDYLEFVWDDDAGRVYGSPWPWCLKVDVALLDQRDNGILCLDGEFLVLALANGQAQYQMLPPTRSDEFGLVRRFRLISAVWWRPPSDIAARFSILVPGSRDQAMSRGDRVSE